MYRKTEIDRRTPAQKKSDEAAAAGDWTGFETEDLLKAGGDHERNFSIANLLSENQIPTAIRVVDVIRVLNDKKISFVLVGTYGFAGWMIPRATQDIEVVVAVRHAEKAARLLMAAFAKLQAEEIGTVVRLRNPANGNKFIDLIRPVVHPYRNVFKKAIWVSAYGQRFRVPSLEIALACKFASIVRWDLANARPYLDAHDFIVMAKENSEIDLPQLAELGELLHPGGGDEVLEMVRKAKAGEKLAL